MSLMLVIAFLIGCLIELTVWLPVMWQLRQRIAPIVLGITALSSLSLLSHGIKVWVLLAVFVGLYRTINLARIISGRMSADYLFFVSRKTSISLIAMQLLLLSWPFVSDLTRFVSYGWYSVAVLQLGFSLVLVASYLRHMRTSRPVTVTSQTADKDLPTVTVAIPARNETDDLVACLESILTSTYPKLEIIVLDDCSQNTRTPELIRSFAHDGVRFVAGKIAPENWLAKNYAYEQLTHEANGELILFCGVDTRFSPETIRVMVESLLTKNKSMLSVMPQNNLPSSPTIRPMLTQPNRYAWELSLPRRWLNRPPVLSTCWLVRRKLLAEAGSFAAITQAVIPERYFADYAVQHDDSYSFFISDRQMGLSCNKSAAEQQATAVRTRYPQLHRRIDLVCLLTLLEAFVLIGPFMTLVYAIRQADMFALIVAASSCLLLIGLYVSTVTLTYRRFLFRALGLMPIAALFDIGLLQYSMWQYEFGSVLWKGRNVCLPLMQVIPRLPKS